VSDRFAQKCGATREEKNMRRSVLLLTVLGATLLLTGGVALVATLLQGTATDVALQGGTLEEPADNRASANEPARIFGADPRHADPRERPGCPKAVPQKLPPDALAGATRAALVYFENIEEAEGQYAVAAYRGLYATRSEFWTAGDCPELSPQQEKLLQRRSVEVHLIWPKMEPSASMSQRIVSVARFDGEYRVLAWVH
jgi:hypothetical protein